MTESPGVYRGDEGITRIVLHTGIVVRITKIGESGIAVTGLPSSLSDADVRTIHGECQALRGGR